jgi:hypothetical protein
LPWVTILDARIRKDFALGGASRLTLFLDALNLNNEKQPAVRGVGHFTFTFRCSVQVAGYSATCWTSAVEPSRTFIAGQDVIFRMPAS